MTSSQPAPPTAGRAGPGGWSRLVLLVLAVLSTATGLVGAASAQTAPEPESAPQETTTSTTLPEDAPSSSPATSPPPPTTSEPATSQPATSTTTPTTVPSTTTTTEPPTTSTSTTEAEPVATHRAAAVPVEPPEGFTDEQWRRVRNVVQGCGNTPGEICDRVYDWTGSAVLAQATQWVFDVPLRVVLILAAAYVLHLFVRRAIARNLARIEARSRARAKADPTSSDRSALRMATASATLGSTATVAIFGIAALVALSELGLNLGPMLAGAGIAGIAIGFGAQNLVRDVLAGLFVILEDQYGVGDTIDAGGIATGTVEEFSLRATKLRDVEGTLWFIPNGTIAQVGNMSQLWARAILDIQVAYADDHRRAGDLIKETADRVWREQRPGERIIEEPELWGVQSLNESAVLIRLAVKSAPAEQWKVARTLRGEIKQALLDAGFEVPFPQRSIWVRSDAAGIDGLAFGQPATEDPAGR